MMTLNKLISIAEGEVGYLEKASSKDLDHKTKNVGSANYTKYSEPFGVNGCYWCCYFIMWLFYTACGNDKTKMKNYILSITGACETLRTAFKAAKQYYDIPHAGDLIFFSGTRHSGANHIGLVYKVTSSTVYTIEGNASTGAGVTDNGGGVVKKSYPVNHSKILGYGRPKYDTEEKMVQSESKVLQSAKYFDKSVAGTYITSNDVYGRYGAGKDKFKAIKIIAKGSEVKCFGYYNELDGVRWYLVKSGETSMYVCGKYLRKR